MLQCMIRTRAFPSNLLSHFPTVSPRVSPRMSPPSPLVFLSNAPPSRAPLPGWRRVRLDVWDSGVSRDESMGFATISLDMALENTIQARGGVMRV